MNMMFEALFLLSEKDPETKDYRLYINEPANKLRVPISALIDYKGFRCLAIGQIPIQED